MSLFQLKKTNFITSFKHLKHLTLQPWSRTTLHYSQVPGPLIKVSIILIFLLRISSIKPELPGFLGKRKSFLPLKNANRPRFTFSSGGITANSRNLNIMVTVIFAFGVNVTSLWGNTAYSGNGAVYNGILLLEWTATAVKI